MTAMKTVPTEAPPETGGLSINTEELAVLGLNAIAYARPSTEEHDGPAEGFTIHAANGHRIGWAPNLDLAHAAIAEHNMRPLPLH